MIVGVLKYALMITSFVLIEYIKVQTRGAWQQILRNSLFGQYLLGATLG